jgi:hypothetical protein
VIQKTSRSWRSIPYPPSRLPCKQALDIWIQVQEFDIASPGSLALRVIEDQRGDNHARNLV